LKRVPDGTLFQWNHGKWIRTLDIKKRGSTSSRRLRRTPLRSDGGPGGVRAQPESSLSLRHSIEKGPGWGPFQWNYGKWIRTLDVKKKVRQDR